VSSGLADPTIVLVWGDGSGWPTLWLEEVLPVKSWNSLSACSYGLFSSIPKEKFFTPVIFFMNNSVQDYMTHSLNQAYMILSAPYLLFIKNRKVTLLVLKLLSETYICSVVFVINCSWRERYFFNIWKPGLSDPTIVLTWQKYNNSIPGLNVRKCKRVADSYLNSSNTIILFATQSKNDNTAFHRHSAVSGGLVLLRVFVSGRLNIKCESAVWKAWYWGEEHGWMRERCRPSVWKRLQAVT